MKRTFLFCALLALLTGANAQETTDYKEKHPYKDWVKIAPKLDDAFFTTPEAIRIADNVLLYQQTTGGWPKNIYMPAELTADEYKKALAAKDNVNQSTIDNNATSTEIRYLSRVYLATDIEKYKEAALEGIRYILKAQYPNGGWPQFWPRPKGYYTHITYNDNAMVNVMNLLRDVYNKKAPYTYVPDTLCQRARAAFDKGVECILNTQVKQNGKLTVWCAQHDEHTLAPAKARAYELPSLSGAESDNIVLLLMSIPDPSPEIIASVEAAIAWFKANKITGIMRENFTNSEGKKDYRMIPCPQDDYPCPVLWARFYTLEDNRPFFCDRDGVKKYDISEIGYERRNGYSWYNNAGLKVLKKYEQWKKRIGNEAYLSQHPFRLLPETAISHRYQKPGYTECHHCRTRYLQRNGNMDSAHQYHTRSGKEIMYHIHTETAKSQIGQRSSDSFRFNICPFTQYEYGNSHHDYIQRAICKVQFQHFIREVR